MTRSRTARRAPTMVLFLAAGLAGNVWAQGDQPPPNPPRESPPTKPSDTYQPGKNPDNQPPDRQNPDKTYRSMHEMRPVMLAPSDWLEDSTLRGPNDEKLGNVKDLLIARHGGRVNFVLIGHGGVLKIGEKVTAVPFRALAWNPDKKYLTISMTADQFKAAPTLDSGEWKTLGEAPRTEPIYSFFNIRHERDMDGAGRDRDMDTERPAVKPDEAPRLKPDEFPVIRMSDIKGEKLVGSDGRDVGKVNEVILDTSSGRLAFVAVTFGGFLGIGDEKVAVPWPAFDINKDGHLFLTSIDKETIKSAPRIKDKDWAELRDPAFGANVYKHFGRHAPWLEKTPHDEPLTQAQRQYDQAFAAGTPKSVSGTIASVDEQMPMDGMPKMVILTVNTAPGDTVTAHACPKSFLDDSRVQLRKGDSVVLKGREVTCDGKRVLVVTQITGADGRPITLRQEDGESKW